MPHDKAAAVLGSYLGVQNLEPASVLDLDVEQITGKESCARTFHNPALYRLDRSNVLGEGGVGPCT